MFDFHSDKERYFKFQYLTSRDHIIPFINDYINQEKPLHVLEIGCAEAGVLKAFTELNHQCFGIELSPTRVKLARQFLADEIENGQIKLLSKDIYEVDIEKDIGHTFDLIILKDVIEHISSQELFIKRLKDFLSPSGKVFFGFPPWQMPFGGHQQLFSNKFLSLLPFIHLLPKFMYKGLMKSFREPENKINDLLEIKDTGITIERLIRILKTENYSILKHRFYLTNPIYQYKFGIKTREQFPLISHIPILRNFVTSCAYIFAEVNNPD